MDIGKISHIPKTIESFFTRSKTPRQKKVDTIFKESKKNNIQNLETKQNKIYSKKPSNNISKVGKTFFSYSIITEKSSQKNLNKAHEKGFDATNWDNVEKKQLSELEKIAKDAFLKDKRAAPILQQEKVLTDLKRELGGNESDSLKSILVNNGATNRKPGNLKNYYKVPVPEYQYITDQVDDGKSVRIRRIETTYYLPKNQNKDLREKNIPKQVGQAIITENQGSTTVVFGNWEAQLSEELKRM